MAELDRQAASQCQSALAGAGVDMPLLRENSPVFAEPWQAQAFAMTLALHDQGLFTWQQWAQALSESIKASQHQGDPDTGKTYYHHWLAALEQMVLRVKAVRPAELLARQAGWQEAAARTPHGLPIELSASERSLPDAD